MGKFPETGADDLVWIPDPLKLLGEQRTPRMCVSVCVCMHLFLFYSLPTISRAVI